MSAKTHFHFAGICGTAMDAVFKWKNNAPPPEGSPYWATGKVVRTPNCSFTLPLKMLDWDTFYPDTVTPESIVTVRKIQGYVTPNRKVKRSDGIMDFSQNVVPVTILWTVRNSSNIIIGQSQSTHTIYVTWDEPIATLRQETLFNLSCVMANGKDGAVGQDVCRKIFGDFKDKEVQRMDGEVLQFWGVDGPGTILQSKTAKCGGWASFFSSVLSVHGYGSSIVNVDGSNVIFDDKNKHAGSAWIVKGSSTDGKTINRGQGGNGSPMHQWRSHAISMTFDELYDPSYGVGPAETPGIYEDGAVGWYTYTYYNNLTFEDEVVFQARVIGGLNKLHYN